MKPEPMVAKRTDQIKIEYLINTDIFHCCLDDGEATESVEISLQKDGNVYLSYCLDNQLLNKKETTISYDDFCNMVNFIITMKSK